MASRCRLGLDLLFALGIVPVLPLAAQSGSNAWEVQNLRGLPYLTVEAIQRNYGFTDLFNDDERFELKSPSALLQGRVGASSIAVNRLRYDLQYPIELQGGKRMISAFDVTNLVDLLLRPTEHLQPGELKTVYLQAASGDLSISPSSAEVVLGLQEALTGFGLEVRALAENAAPPVADWRHRPEDAVAWLRLGANSSLPSRLIRCGVLATPQSPKLASSKFDDVFHSGVALGNLYDAESIALATFCQFGFAFGPGAKTQRIVDGGIGQRVTEGFGQSPGAAVLVEWGSDAGGEHLLKSIAAGIIRYQGFLKSVKERSNPPAAQSGPAFRVARVEISGEESADAVRIRIKPPDGMTLAAAERAEDLQLQFYFFSAHDGKLRLLPSLSRKTSLAELGVRKLEATGELEITYPLSGLILDQVGASVFGCVVRLRWQGKVHDSGAFPRELLNQSWRFTSAES